MINIDIVYSGYLNAPNGASRFVKLLNMLGPQFRKASENVRVFSQDNFLKRHENDSPVIFDYNKHNRVRSFAKKNIILTALLIYRNQLRPAKKICKHYRSVSDNNPANIIAFQELFTCYIFLKHNKKNRQKVILTLHNSGDVWSMFYDNYPKFSSILFNGFRQKVMRTILMGCDRIGFVANNARLKFCETYHIPLSQSFFVYNGIEKKVINRSNINNNKLNLVTVGTLCSRKNQLGILQAIEMLPIEFQSKIRLTLVGDGPVREDLEFFSRRLKSEIDFVGSSKNVDEYLSSADCFILFSKDEGLPISIIEAMRASLAIIGTRIAGIPELVIDKQNGYLVDVDVNQLFKLLFDILRQDKAHLIEMGKRSFEMFCNKFSTEAMIKEYIDLYKSI